MSNALALDLIREAEGCTLSAKKDTEGWCIGWGHNDPSITEGLVWTQSQADTQLVLDAGIAASDAQYVVGISCWAVLDDARKATLTDMAYELGRPRLLGFVEMIRAIQTGDWKAAHDAALKSLWAEEVPTRAQRDASILLTGVMP